MKKGLIAIIAVLVLLCSIVAAVTACGKLQPSIGLSYKINDDEMTCTVSRGVCTDVNVVIPSVSPDGYAVTAIADSAFKNCGGIMSITIPSSVTSIGNGAFAGCIDLTSVKIPNSVISIGSSAFSGCSRIKSITIPNSVRTIGERAFLDCDRLTSITIPNSVISEFAFYSCAKLTSVTIPRNVTWIRLHAFSFCKELTDIYYNGTIEQWNAIEKKHEWDLDTGDYTVHCTDGDIKKDN